MQQLSKIRTIAAARQLANDGKISRTALSFADQTVAARISRFYLAQRLLLCRAGRECARSLHA